MGGAGGIQGPTVVLSLGQAAVCTVLFTQIGLFYRDRFLLVGMFLLMCSSSTGFAYALECRKDVISPGGLLCACVAGMEGWVSSAFLVSLLQSVCMVSWKHLLAACRGFPGQQNKERITPCKKAQQVFPGAEVETLDSPKLTMSL